MPDRIEMATQFVQDMLNIRDDVIGALVCGSVARGEAIETSDIDLSIYIKKDKGEPFRSLACWQEGIFIECGLFTTEGLSSPEEVMGNPLDATQINDAVIIYDPTGYFGRLQGQVRNIFMQPRWLRLRLDFALDLCRTHLIKLQESTTVWDPDGICSAVRMISHAAPAVPLYQAGITPSSTRKLWQLSDVHPGIRGSVIELECSLPLAAEDFDGMIDTCRKYRALRDSGGLQGITDYKIRKVESMVSHGALNDALDTLWCILFQEGGVVTPGNRKVAYSLLAEWISEVGWNAEAVDEKLRIADSLVREAETIAGKGDQLQLLQ